MSAPPAVSQAGYDGAKLRAELTRDEGKKPHVYPDSLGFWTIGIGHLVDKRKGGRISEAAIQFIFEEDLAEKAADLDRELPWWRTLSDARQRVLLNMTFNLGIGSRKPAKGLLAFHNTLAAIREGRWNAAAAGMLDSLWARQVGPRAERLAAMMRQG